MKKIKVFFSRLWGRLKGFFTSKLPLWLVYILCFAMVIYGSCLRSCVDSDSSNVTTALAATDSDSSHEYYEFFLYAPIIYYQSSQIRLVPLLQFVAYSNGEIGLKLPFSGSGYTFRPLTTANCNVALPYYDYQDSTPGYNSSPSSVSSFISVNAISSDIAVKLVNESPTLNDCIFTVTQKASTPVYTYNGISYYWSLDMNFYFSNDIHIYIGFAGTYKSSSDISLNSDDLNYRFWDYADSDLSYHNGYNVGYKNGESAGYKKGLSDGNISGEAYQNGYDSGYEKGLAEGSKISLSDVTPWDILVNGLDSFFNIKLFGTISIGTIFRITVSTLLICFVIKIFI